MKKILILTLLICTTFLFSACEIPFYTKYQVKQYLNKVESDFNKISSKVKETQSTISQDVTETQKIKESVDECLDDITEAKDNLNNSNPPKEIQDLNSKLTQYYNDLEELTDEMKIMFDFLALADQAANDLSSSANKLPSDFNQSTAKLIKEFTESKTNYQKYLQDLKNEDVPDSFYQAKISLMSVIDAYNDYLTSVIKGLKTKNTYYFDVDQFVRQMDDGMSRFTVQIEMIEKRGDFTKRSEEISSQGEVIKNYISELKNKYRIK